MLDETNKALNKNIEQLQSELNRTALGKKKSSNPDEESSDMQILILENKTLKQKLNAASKNDTGNDFNPEFLKLQAELNKRESENLML